jgi:hypothetical protein
VAELGMCRRGASNQLATDRFKAVVATLAQTFFPRREAKLVRSVCVLRRISYR